MSEFLTSLRYVTELLANETGERFTHLTCWECNTIHEYHADKCCAVCDVNYCMESWCSMPDIDDVYNDDMLIQCLNRNNEYEFRCPDHATSCDACGENSTTEICYGCEQIMQLHLNAKKLGYKVKRIKR